MQPCTRLNTDFNSPSYEAVVTGGLRGDPRVKLVTQGEVVLVPLLDLEDLGLELRDEEVLLV